MFQRTRSNLDSYSCINQSVACIYDKVTGQCRGIQANEDGLQGTFWSELILYIMYVEKDKILLHRKRSRSTRYYASTFAVHGL